MTRRCRSASASRRARRGRSTSATRSARSPTAPSPTSTVARSSCGSTTPIPSARCPAGRRRSSPTSRWLGIDVGRGADPAERAGRASRRGGGARARRTAPSATPTARSGSRARRSRAPTGRATYQLATVVDDLDLGITHIIRGSDHRPNEEVQQRIARALGGELPEVIHHGLLLGEDGKKLSKRAEHSSVADLRDEGIPAAAVRAYLDELGLPRHDVSLDLAAHPPARDRRDRRDAGRRPRRRRRTPRSSSRGRSAARARSSRHARSPRQILEPAAVALGDEARPTLERFAELRGPGPEPPRRARRARDRARAQGGRRAT